MFVAKNLLSSFSELILRYVLLVNLSYELSDAESNYLFIYFFD